MSEEERVQDRLDPGGCPLSLRSTPPPVVQDFEAHTGRHTGYADERECLRFTLKEREFLATLCRVLPKLVCELEKPSFVDFCGYPNPSQLFYEEEHEFKSGTTRVAEPCYSVHSESKDSLLSPRAFPQEIDKFAVYARSCQGLREKIQEFENKFRYVGGGVHTKKALLRLRQEIVTQETRMRKNIETPEFGDELRPEAALEHRTTVYHLLAAYAHKLWAFHHALMAFGDEFYENACLAPLDALATYINNQADIFAGKDVAVEEMSGSDARLRLIEMLPFLSEGMDDVVCGLTKFIDLGIPTILAAQQTESARYLTMTGVATFFSAVTATTLQLSYAYAADPRASLAVAVNALWFVALVFSTASAVNSLLGLTWRQTPGATLVRQLPRWAALWLVRGPMIFLVIASGAFSVGLCLFAFSSSQHKVTSILTAVFTGAHAFALFALASLYFYDQQQLHRLAGAGNDNLPTAQEPELGMKRPVVARLARWFRLCWRRESDAEECDEESSEFRREMRQTPPEMGLGRDIEMQAGLGSPDTRTVVAEESPGVAPPGWPWTRTRRTPNLDRTATLVAEEPIEKHKREFNAHSSLGSAQGSSGDASSTVCFSPNSSLGLTISNSGAGLGNAGSLWEADRFGRLDCLRDVDPERLNSSARDARIGVDVAQHHRWSSALLRGSL
ncbi:hypothetical protein M0805_005184 [Coniferiporia weirii]|nr:hypothetical protein M0805_005184 [Coniferiporia weirii]